MAPLSSTDRSAMATSRNPSTLWGRLHSVQPWLLALAAGLGILTWAYWPNLQYLSAIWANEPNYSHGILVVPIALLIFWQRLVDPTVRWALSKGPWWAWTILIAILVLRVIAYERNYLWIESATLIPMVFCLLLTLGGWPLLERGWPAAIFLVFMLPLPPSINGLISRPLQQIATLGSVFMMQLTGLRVIAEGNVIYLPDAPANARTLEVALACNGLSMLMTLAATVTATIILFPLPTWKRVVVLASALPIALVSNVIRIVATGWCYTLIVDESAKKLAHDSSGWLMMPLALILVGLEVWILSWLAGDGGQTSSPADRPVLAMFPKPSNKGNGPRVNAMTVRDTTREPVWVWGVPFMPLTLAQTAEAVSTLIKKGQPTFFITANTHYTMLTRENPDLETVNARAAFIVADGAPLVWATRHRPNPLPERVAGSDLIYTLSELAARRGYRLFFAGGAPGVAEEAARKLTVRYPGLQVVGTAAPSFENLTAEDYGKLRAQIIEARPHLLIVAASMPHGERWLSTHLEDLGVPVGVNLGASIDFAAGRLKRAPRWMQKSGLEWAFRMMLEPGRLFSRYARNARFILSMSFHGSSLVRGPLATSPLATAASTSDPQEQRR